METNLAQAAASPSNNRTSKSKDESRDTELQRPLPIVTTGLLSLLLTTSKRLTITAIIAGVVGGMSSASIIAVINAAIAAPRGSAAALIWPFVGLCLARLVSSVVSNLLLIHLDQEIILKLRLVLSRQILATPLRQLEAIGPHRLWGAIGHDVFDVTAAVTNVPSFVISLANTVACLVYLGYLSLRVLAVVLGFVVLGVVINDLIVRKAMRYIRTARDKEDALLKQYHALVYGMKELKLNRLRREMFLTDTLKAAALAFRRYIVIGNTIFTGATVWGSIMFYILIGLLVFGMPAVADVRIESLMAYTIVIIHMMDALTVLTSTFPILGRASVALKKMQSLGVSLSEVAPDLRLARQEQQQASWDRIDVVGATHEFKNDAANQQFTLGPIDLSFRPGEIVFLAGGNGSGKTTLAKLLTGLYTPESGEIRLDGEPVTPENLDDYRQMFAVVFSDFHLFETIQGVTHADLDGVANEHLKRLQLDHKVQVSDGVLSTIDLSQGQRKRIALMSAFLEDRPFYVFDEWAADQDPHFREIFYLQILDELKRKGKTVLVISHDDRYYGLADRLIKLDYGQVLFDRIIRSEDGALLDVEQPEDAPHGGTQHATGRAGD